MTEPIFAGMGGSGSTYLRAALATSGYEVHNKPDTVYRRLWLRESETVRQREFYRRSNGYELKRLCVIDDIRGYLDYVQHTPGVTAVLNTWAEQRILRLCGKRLIVFVLRDPVSAYRSMCEPHRHGDTAAGYGGPDSWFAVLFAQRWCDTVYEYLHTRSQGWPVRLWWYESLGPCAEEDGFGGLFPDWEPSQRTVGSLLSNATENLIRDCTHDTLYQIVQRGRTIIS